MSRKVWVILILLILVGAVVIYFLFFSGSSDSPQIAYIDENNGVFTNSGFGVLSPNDNFRPGDPVYSAKRRLVYRGTSNTSSPWVIYADHPPGELLGYFEGIVNLWPWININKFPKTEAYQFTGVIPFNNSGGGQLYGMVLNTRPAGGGDEIIVAFTPDLYTYINS